MEETKNEVLETVESVMDNADFVTNLEPESGNSRIGGKVIAGIVGGAVALTAGAVIYLKSKKKKKTSAKDDDKTEEGICDGVVELDEAEKEKIEEVFENEK